MDLGRMAGSDCRSASNRFTTAHLITVDAGCLPRSCMDTSQQTVQVGQRYIGWGKTWLVTKVWPQGVVDAVNVADPSNRIRWPEKQFRSLKPTERK